MVGRLAFLTVEYMFVSKTGRYCFFQPFCLCFILSIFAKQAFLPPQNHSPAKKKAQERGDKEYDPEEEHYDIVTPKKGCNKKKEPDRGLTMGTDIEDYLKLDAKQVEVNLENIRFDTEKKNSPIGRRDMKLLAKRVESLEASPPTRPIYVVPRVDDSMFSLVCVPTREASRIDGCTYLQRWGILVCVRTTQRSGSSRHPLQATRKLSGFAEVTYYRYG